MRSLVTGAAEGLGAALADALLERGHVTGVDVQAEPMRARAQAEADRFEGIICDLADREAVARLPDRLSGPFNFVALSAGVSATGKFEELDPAAYLRLMEINVGATIGLFEHLLTRDMLADGANVVFVSSLSHATGYPGAAVYAASKDAVAVYARSVARPMRKRGIGITCVFPGPIRTAQAARHAPSGAKAEKRMDPADVALRILGAADRGKRVSYPGGAALAAYSVSRVAPRTLTRFMRRAIFDKLPGPRT